MNLPEHIIDAAIENAKKSNVKTGQYGVLVYRNKIISSGFNYFKKDSLYITSLIENLIFRRNGPKLEEFMGTFAE